MRIRWSSIITQTLLERGSVHCILKCGRNWRFCCPAAGAGMLKSLSPNPDVAGTTGVHIMVYFVRWLNYRRQSGRGALAWHLYAMSLPLVDERCQTFGPASHIPAVVGCIQQLLRMASKRRLRFGVVERGSGIARVKWTANWLRYHLLGPTSSGGKMAKRPRSDTITTCRGCAARSRSAYLRRKQPLCQVVVQVSVHRLQQR